jgi:eukaryotic-like serine/threonine-protein kinase
MSITIGSRFGSYEITALLGRGGMGEVYRSRDTRLKRDVAIKILSAEFSQDSERVRRFQQEAEALAALNHPHIAQIYGIEQESNMRALVLEFVEGEDLAQRLKRGPIPLDEAISIAKQIVAALEATHEHGLIHRDLKPANIKIRPDGTVKVLDFGLAKASDLSSSTSSPSSDVLTNSPTLVTGAGIIIGTAAYMSPEQAKGRLADKRSDIWAFGCVLFEMLSGTRPFLSGENVSVTEVLASIMRDEPAWNSLPETTPGNIRRLLRRCLAKDPGARLRDIGDAALELNESREPFVDVAKPAASSKSGGRLRLLIPVAALVLGAILAGIYLKRTTTAPAPPATRLMITPSGPTALTITGGGRDLAISHDGKRVVYVGGNGHALFVRELDRLDSVQIYQGGQPYNPFFSPDGKWVAFNDGISAFRKVPAGGGPAELICRITLPGLRASWGVDGTIVFSTGPLQRVPATGGTPQQLTAPDSNAGEANYNDPEWLPDGKLQVRGSPAALDEPIYTPTFSDTPDFDVSENGTLVYIRDDVQVAARLPVWVNRDGREEAIALPVRAYTYPSIAPDGKQAAFDIRDQENDTWIWDFSRGTLRRLTFDPGYNQSVVWTPDSKRIVNTLGGLIWKQADGSGATEELLKPGGGAFS